jgi:alpha-1,3-glucosyltransferase
MFSGRILDPKFMELHNSRGYETQLTKLYMRATVMVSDLLIYVTAVYFVTTVLYQQKKTRSVALLMILLQPAIILIDHGHFQYE